MTDLKENVQTILIMIAVGIIILFTLTVLFFCSGVINSYYEVWAQGKMGEAEVNRAEWNRTIATLEAQAKKESAKQLSEADIIRAQGVAEANRIIGSSLKDNESYLKYLWIQNLDKEHNKVIYIPTEANLPILEASRLNLEEKKNDN